MSMFFFFLNVSHGQTARAQIAVLELKSMGALESKETITVSH